MDEHLADEHERTMAFAKLAFGQIRALRQPATPRNYEVWYTYVTGYNPQLNQLINDLLSRNGQVTEADLEQLHETQFSPTRQMAQLNQVGTQVKDEIDQVMAMIEAAAGTATSYTESLAGVTQQLGATKDREGLRSIVESLVQTAKDMELSNQALEARLNASRQEIHQLQENLETVRHESLTDPLTTLANRKFFDQALEKALGDAATKREPLSLMMTDIDHFKTFNDSYGHQTGDQVLRLVALSVKNNIKGQDIAARYGGEEFAVVLPNTVLRSATTVADHIRRAVMTKQLMKRSTHEQLGRITISIGVATMRDGDTAQSLIGRADACLYAAKHAGRNRVIGESDPEATGTSSSKVA
jgi:diguanylate cyclase